MSALVIADPRRIQPLTYHHHVTPSRDNQSEAGGYSCVDCGRTYRRQATYRRHIRDAHDDSNNKPQRRQRRSSCSGNSEQPANVVVDMETVENCCLDNEICLDDEASNGNFSRHCSTAENIEHGAIASELDLGIKVEIADDGDIADDELMQFQTVATTASMKPNGLHLETSVLNRLQVKQENSVTCPENSTFIGCDTKLSQLISDKLHPMELTASSPQTLATSGVVSAAATTSSSQKIIVYVKTEQQPPNVHITENESLPLASASEQLMTSSRSVVAASSAGCQYICPICQRCFNSEKYLSMHVSSYHRSVADGLQQQQQQQQLQQQQQQLQQQKAVALMDNSVVAPTTLQSSVAAVAVAAACRRLQGQQNGKQQLNANKSTGNSSPAAFMTSSPPAPAPERSKSSSQWTCHICNKTFAQNSSYKNHIRTHSDDRPFVCSICSIGFKERYHLKKHALFKHTTELNETCRVCGKRFKDSTAVRAHERIHSDVRPYGCTLCGKTFKTSECLWHHENRSKTCGKMAVAAAAMAAGSSAASQPAITSAEAKQVIRRLHHQQQQEPRLTASTGTRRHRRTTSATSGNGQQPLASTGGSIGQSVLEVQTAVQAIAGADKMVLVGRPENAELMAACSTIASTSASGFVITTSSTIDAGIAQNQSVTKLITSSTTTLSEELTGLVSKNNNTANVATTAAAAAIEGVGGNSVVESLFNDPSLSSLMFGSNACSNIDDAALVDEFWQDFDMEQMTADYCNYSVDDPDIDDLDTNMETASSTTETASSLADTIDSELSVPEELFKDILATSSSSAELSNERSLKRKNSVSSASTTGGGSGSKRYDCGRCDKRFASAATLEKHLLIHAEIRPYRCSVCDIGFKLKVHLKKHNLYRHSDDYPCECSVCGKRFKDSSAVRLHERIHSTDRPFQCLHCGKSFKTKENLWGHRNRGPCEKLPTSSSPPQQSLASSTASASSSFSMPVVVATSMPEVHQQFRLFHSAEFGPILGVPLSARFVQFCDVMKSEADPDANEDRKSRDSSGDSPASGSPNTVDKQTVPSALAVLPKISSVMLGQKPSAVASNAADQTKSIQPRVVVASTVATSTTANQLLSAVPTAVVAPIKRHNEGGEIPASSSSAAAQNRPTSLLLPSSSVKLLTTSLNQTAANVGSREGDRPLVSGGGRQQNESRKRSNSASVSDRRTTTGQKYVARDQAINANHAVGRKRFQLAAISEPASVQTSAHQEGNGGGIEDIGLTLSLNDGITNTSAVELLLNANGEYGNVESGDDENRNVLGDWQLDVGPAAGDDVTRGKWNSLMISSVRPEMNVTDDEHVTEFTSTDIINGMGYEQVTLNGCREDHSSRRGKNVNNNNSGGDDDDSVGRMLNVDDDIGALIDQFNTGSSSSSSCSTVTTTSDAMWCSNPAWTPDNDLGGLLTSTFAPNC